VVLTAAPLSRPSFLPHPHCTSLEGNPPFYLNQLASSFCEKRILTDARKLPKPWGTESLAGVEEIWKGKWSKKFLSVKGDKEPFHLAGPQKSALILLVAGSNEQASSGPSAPPIHRVRLGS
jgi:hypothetical protein